jgi:hypothetical protein
MAIVSAVTADYYLVDIRYSKYHHFYMMFLSPLILYIACLFILFETPSLKLEGDVLSKVLRIEITIVVFSCVYALIHKGHHILAIEEAELGARE